jgi:deoxyribonuclease V
MIVPRAPHRWSVTPSRAIAIQRALADRVRARPPRKPIQLVAGVDAAFSTDGKQCLAAVVVWDMEAQTVIEERTASRPLTFPYVPGLLSFREAPAILAALRKLRAKPDAIMCDGQGLAHPRRFGIACHVGVIVGLPTIGCAKSRLIGTHDDPANARGSRAPLRDRGEIIGSVLRTQDGVSPVYVSVGHLIELASCERLVTACATRSRLPEPTRLADRLVARLKRGRV